MKSRTFAIAIASAALTLSSSPVLAQTVSTTGQWERPYGVAAGQENRPFTGATSAASAASRGEAGNRVIINGLIQTGVGVSSQLGSFGSGVGSTSTAIGNQLNVNVQGRWNTVVINSNQTNNGDINANAQANGNVSSSDD